MLVGANKSILPWTGFKAYTSNAAMKQLRAIGNIPNTTTLLGNTIGEKAPPRSWSVPPPENWVNAENENILRTMLSQVILTCKQRVRHAAQSAIEDQSVLNA